MRILLWIFMAFWILLEIPSPEASNNTSSNNSSLSMNQWMQKNRSGNSCRFGILGKIPTNLGSQFSEQVTDRFLLSTCNDCLHHIFYNETPGLFFDYKDDSQMQDACSMHKDSTISVEDCLKRVRQCCKDAEKCCLRQLENSTEPSSSFCPMTWDGVSCIDETPTNLTIKVTCPTFIDHFLGQKSAEKHCLHNGSWLTTTENNKTWEPTDYFKCAIWFIENEYLLAQIKASILILSLVLLITSLCIFIFFKSLRSQQRIRIHINLFLTMFFKTIFELMNTVMIAMDIYLRITDSKSQSKTMLQENMEACKWITILLRFFQNSTFCWMLCEALFLHQLLFRTFEHIPSIKMYLVIGWVVPSIYTMIYFFIRRFHKSFKGFDRQCWVEELPKMEYLMRGPNIIVMVINIILLINILCLIRNLPSQPSDRSYWKRTLKAVLILVPLFGLQFILVAFHIDSKNRFYFGYSLLQNVVQYSQGVAVPLAFCAMNQEVFNVIKQKFHFKCTSYWSLPRNHSVNRYSNSSRCSDHMRMISAVQSHIPMNVRRSGNDRLSAELLKKPVSE